MRVAVLLVVFMISGCAVYRGNNIPEVTLADIAGAEEQRVSASYLSTAFGGMPSPRKLPNSVQNTVSGELRSVLESSEFFGRISKGDESADIKVDITVTSSGSPAAIIPAIITGMSFYIIPSWATDNINVVAKVERADGLVKEYVLDDSVKLVQWIPMAFAFPRNNFSVVTDVRKNMYRKLLSDMRDDGFFHHDKVTLSVSR
jgi:hypothetical protein